MKTIGYILSAFPVLSETFIGTEMRAMQKRGHRVVPIVLTSKTFPGQEIDLPLIESALYLPDQAGDLALRAALTPSLAAGRALAFWIAQCKSPRRSLLWNAWKVAALARANGCDHLHAHFAGGAAAHAIVAARWAGLGVSFTGHGHDIYAEPEDLPQKLSAVDFAASTCRDMSDEFKRLAPETLVRRVICGVDPIRFRPRSGMTPDNGRYLFIGRLVEAKGGVDLLAALAQARQQYGMSLHLDIVGDGPLRATLEAQVAALDLGAQVRFLGAKPSTWIVAEGPNYRALICPFKEAANGERDSGPVVAKEAMAMAVPVIASAFMGLKEMVAPDTGFLFPRGDRAALTQALLAMEALTPLERRQMGNAGRQRLCTLFTDWHQAFDLSAAIEQTQPSARPIFKRFRQRGLA